MAEDPTTEGATTEQTAESSSQPEGAANGKDRATAAVEVEVLEQEAPFAPEGRRQSALWLRAGELRARMLGDSTGARQCFENARRAAPDWQPARRACRMAALLAEDWKGVAELLAEEVDSLADPVDAAAELAEILAHRLEQPEEALGQVLTVLDRQPAHPQALALLDKLLGDQKKWDELATRFTRAAESAQDSGRAASLFYEAGQIHRMKRGDDASATSCFEKALEADSGCVVALKALAEVAAKTSDWSRLARVLEREAGSEPGAELAAGALIHLALVREDLLEDAAGASEAYRRALEADANNLLAIQGLARFAETQSNPVELARIYERELALTTDPVQSAAIRYVLGELCEGSLQAPERAVNHYRKALEAQPDHGPAFRALGQLYSRLGEWKELAELYQQEALQTEDRAYQAHTWYKLAELYEERLQDEDMAIQFHRRVLDAAPDYLPALRALGRLLAKRQDWSSLAELYEGEINVTEDDHHRALLLAKLAELYDERLGNYEEAARCHRRILEIDAENVNSVRALARLAYRRGDWNELVTMNLREIELVSEPRVIAALYQKTGEIYEEHLEEVEQAYECYRQALERVPSYLPALRSLGRLASSHDDWEEVARTMEIEAEQVGDTERAQSLLLGAAEVYEKRLEDSDRAVETYRRLLERRPGYAPAVRALARLLREGQDWAALATLLRETLGRADDERAPGLLQALAEIVGHRLNKDGDAIDLLQKAWELVPERAAPMRSLEEYLARNDRWVELAEVYRQAAELAPSGAYRAALYVRLGDLARDVADNAEFAISYYRSALQESPGDRTALSRLKRVAVASGDMETLAQCLASEAQRASDKEERRVLMLELGSVHEVRGRRAQAADCYAIAAKLGSDAELWARAARAFHAAERYQEAVDAYISAAEHTRDDPGERDRWRMAAAEILEADLNDLGSAATILMEISGESADSLGALLALERVEAARSNHEALASIRRKLADLAREPKRALFYRLLAAETLAKTLNKPEEAAAELEKVLAMDPSRMDAARMLGSIREKLGNVDAAIQAFEAASKAAPNDRDPLIALERLYTSKEAWEPLLTVYNRLITSAPDPEHAADAFYKKGVVLQEKLDMVDKAKVHYERALDTFGRHAASMERMYELHRDSLEWKEARDILERLLQIPGYRTANRLVDLGQTLDKGFSEDQAAISAFREALQLDPKNSSALEALAEILERTSDWSGLVAVYQELSQGAPKDRWLVLQAKLAELYEKRLDRPEDAANAWRQVLREQPKNLEAHEALARIFAKRPDTADASLKAHRDIISIDPTRVTSYQALASYYQEKRLDDRRLAVLDVLAMMRAANDEEMAYYNELFRELPRPGATDQTLRETDLTNVLAHPEAREWAGNFVRHVGDAIAKSRSVDLKQAYGVDKNAKVAPNAQQPLRQRVDAVASLFGLPAVTLYIAADKDVEWFVDFTDAPTLILGRGVGALSLTAQDFLLGKALFYAAANWYPLLRTSPKKLEQELLMAAAAVGAGAQPANARDAAVAKQVKAITKAIPRRRRKELASEMAEFARNPGGLDYDAMIALAEFSSDRAGLLSSRSIGRGLEVLSKLDSSLAGVQLDDPDSLSVALKNSPRARELLQFAISEDYFVLRKKLRLGIL